MKLSPLQAMQSDLEGLEGMLGLPKAEVVKLHIMTKTRVYMKKK